MKKTIFLKILIVGLLLICILCIAYMLEHYEGYFTLALFGKWMESGAITPYTVLTPIVAKYSFLSAIAAWIYLGIITYSKKE